MVDQARAALVAELRPVAALGQLDPLLVGHLEEQQEGDLLDVVAVVDAIVAKGMAEAPEFLDDVASCFVLSPYLPSLAACQVCASATIVPRLAQTPLYRGTDLEASGGQCLSNHQNKQLQQVRNMLIANEPKVRRRVDRPDSEPQDWMGWCNQLGLYSPCRDSPCRARKSAGLILFAGKSLWQINCRQGIVNSAIIIGTAPLASLAPLLRSDQSTGPPASLWSLRISLGCG